MHPKIYAHFEELFDRFPPPGLDVLELGAPQEPSVALLSALARRMPGGQYIGVNLREPEPGRILPYELIQGNANDLSAFADASFDAVVTNAMLEHDAFFWRTIAETRRVLRPGGRFYLGVPGYRRLPPGGRRIIRSVLISRATDIPGLRSLKRLMRLPWLVSTPTYIFHGAPSDYWRFSPEAVRRVLLEGMTCLELIEVMHPVRILAVGEIPSDSGVVSPG